MTKQDYVLLAAAFRSSAPPESWLTSGDTYQGHAYIQAKSQRNADIMAVADALQRENPRFNKTLFYKAIYE